MIENLSPAPDDFAFAVEHRDVEGDLRSLERPCSRLPRSSGDEFANRYAARFRLPQNQQRRIGILAKFDEIGGGAPPPPKVGKQDAQDAARLGVTVGQALSELFH